MTTVFVSRPFVERFGEALQQAAREAGNDVHFMIVPEDGGRLAQAQCDRIDCTFVDRDIRSDERLHAAYSDALVASRSCRWIHLTSSGIHPEPYILALDRKGAVITSSTGSNAEPVAQTGFTGLLMLARGFPQYIRAQRDREWRPLRGAALPEDLRGQTVLLIGVGAIGRVFAGYARAFGLRVIGVRRTPAAATEAVDEMHAPSKLPELLPTADWIVVACPLTPETRNLLDAAAFARMKQGARLINIARGEVVNEEAMIEALKSGRLAGAHLDAHTREPLPPESALWDLPNVVVSPHNASASRGNEKRAAEMFIANYRCWARGEPLRNVQKVYQEG